MAGDAPVFVGIDGGGTRSAALATDAAGRPLARTEGPPGLLRPGRAAATARTLAALARRTLRAAGARPPASALCCAVAGAGRDPERSALQDALLATGVARAVVVTTDAEAALHDAFGTGPGLLLASGTGSIAWGRAPDGRTARAGGWGALLGDEGSGYALGLAALRAAARAHDGRGPATPLVGAVLRATGAPAPEDLIAWSAAASKAEIAALAPTTLDAARQGDPVALELLRAAAAELATHVAALHRRLGPWTEPPPLALAGRLLEPGSPLREATLEAIAALGIPARALDTTPDGARGAAALARAAARP